jgi:hypothetical protein
VLSIEYPWAAQVDLRAYVKTYRAGPSLDLIDPVDYVERIALLEADAATYGFDQTLLARSLGVEVDERAIVELALQLLEARADRDSMEREGKTHLVRRQQAVPDSFINELALQMLGALMESDLPVSQPLYVLLRVQMNAGGYPANAPRDMHARKLAAIILGSDSSIAIRRLARALGVNPSTISRWRNDPKFQEEVVEAHRARLQNVSALIDKLERVRKTRGE